MGTSSFVLSFWETLDMLVVVMGVCGSGKTTVGIQLAEWMGCSFADADQFHSDENKAKMSKGQPLNDKDRLPWLLSIHQYMEKIHKEGNSAVLTCSALKRSYRTILSYGSHGQPNSDSGTEAMDAIPVHHRDSPTDLHDNSVNVPETVKTDKTERSESIAGSEFISVQAPSNSKGDSQMDRSLALTSTNPTISFTDKQTNLVHKSNQNQDSKSCDNDMKPVFVHLVGSIDVLNERMSNRKGHFMPKSLLQSQLDTLEELDNDENGFSVDIDEPVDELIMGIKSRLGLNRILGST